MLLFSQSSVQTKGRSPLIKEMKVNRSKKGGICGEKKVFGD